MLSDRIAELFRLLQCSNTDIVRFAGCSPSNISRLKRGLTRPKPGSRSALRLAEGIYRYADYENMLYMSGMSEPYVFRRPKNPRFYHTLFLRPGKAAIQSFSPWRRGRSACTTISRRKSAWPFWKRAMRPCSPAPRRF